MEIALFVIGIIFLPIYFVYKYGAEEVGNGRDDGIVAVMTIIGIPIVFGGVLYVFMSLLSANIISYIIGGIVVCGLIGFVIHGMIDHYNYVNKDKEIRKIAETLPDPETDEEIEKAMSLCVLRPRTKENAFSAYKYVKACDIYDELHPPKVKKKKKPDDGGAPNE